jgi:hypothetical protein
MYAIGCKFPEQKRFLTMDIKTGEQVNNWVYCTLFKTRERPMKYCNNYKKLLSLMYN